MRYLSVCSGIEAASVAWHGLGWKPLAFSEIEAFPRAVLSHRYPNVPLHGDFTVLRDQPWIVDADVLVGGTPCQAFSVAGLRGSLSDDRGNLSLEFVRLANAIDDLRRDAGRPPAYILWENVPGVLTVSDNAFGAFLAGLVGHDAPINPPKGRGWTYSGVVSGPRRVAAWRCLDAQHFGLAQRRKRVFVLSIEHPRGWAAADALLPIIDSMQGHPAPRRKAAKDIAPRIAPSLRARSNASHRLDSDAYVAMCLNAKGGSGRMDAESETLVPVAFEWQRGASQNLDMHEDFSPALIKSQTPAIAFSSKDYGADAGLIAPTLRAMGHNDSHANAGGQLAVCVDLADTLSVGANQTTGFHSEVAAQGSAVRRLTPKECERLQGFPDGHTNVPYRGKPAADGPRYRALGNSMAVPVMAYIGQRIQAVEEMQRGSLLEAAE